MSSTKKTIAKMSGAAAEWVNIGVLKEWDKNPRKNDAAVASVVKSIQAFGFGAPILARKANKEIIAGHTRVKAAKELGMEQVPVRFLDLSEKDAHTLALADNRLNENAKWDDMLLATVLSDLDGLGVDLGLTGFKVNEIEDLLPSDPTDPALNDIPVEQSEELRKKWNTKRGQIWDVGPHRIMCGDSTKKDDVAKLMDGRQKGRVMWTDPPYGVAYVGKTKDALTIQNDKLDATKLLTFLTDAFVAGSGALQAGAAFYIAHPAGPLSMVFQQAIQAAGWTFRQGLVWVKDSMVLGRSDYHYKHEPIAFGYLPMPKGNGRLGRGGKNWFGDNSQTTVFEIDRPKVNAEHPTMKPVDLIVAMLKNSSDKNDVVYEPFSGSGSTMVAANTTGRVCCAIELDPKYVAVALERMGILGIKANLLA